MKALQLTLIFITLISSTCSAAFSGVEKLFKKKPPVYKAFERIYEFEYKENEFDCSNKAALYVKILNNYGIDACIMLVQNKLYRLHAYVLIKNYNEQKQSVVCDPTNDEWYFDDDIDKLGKFWGFVNNSQINKTEEYSFTDTIFNKLKNTCDKIMKKVL